MTMVPSQHREENSCKNSDLAKRSATTDVYFKDHLYINERFALKLYLPWFSSLHSHLWLFDNSWTSLTSAPK